MSNELQRKSLATTVVIEAVVQEVVTALQGPSSDPKESGIVHNAVIKTETAAANRKA